MTQDDHVEFPEHTHPELEKYITSKGWEFEIYQTAKRTELKIAQCPLCGNTSKNFEINAHNGLYRCWACNAHGSFETLQRKLGDIKDGIARIDRGHLDGRAGKAQAPGKAYKIVKGDRIKATGLALMAGDMGGLDYLHERGLSDETIEHFRLGVVRAKDGKPTLIIPHMRRGDVALIMYRTIPPAEKAYLREPGMESLLFNEDALHESGEEIIVCEGQLDAMSVWQAGCHNVVSVSTGAATEWQDDWIDLLSGFHRIIMVYDGDDAGRKGASRVRQRLGEDRVWIAELPEGGDMNSVLIEAGEAEVKRIISLARPAPVPGVETLYEGILGLQEALVDGDGEEEGYDWFLSHITSTVGKSGPGDLIEIMGQPGTGKTTFMLQQALFLAMVLGIPTLFTCMEMPIAKMARKAIQCYYKLTKEAVSLRVLGDALLSFEGIPLYLSCPSQDVDIKMISEQATSAFKRFGIRAWIVDNLIVLTESSSDPIREQAIVTRTLKVWAVKYGNVCYLIAHPKKTEDGVIEGLGHMRGSAAITANADTVMNLYRRSLAPKKEADIFNFNEGSAELQDPKTAVFPLKVRDSCARVGWMYYHGAESYFRNATKEDFLEAA